MLCLDTFENVCFYFVFVDGKFVVRENNPEYLMTLREGRRKNDASQRESSS